MTSKTNYFATLRGDAGINRRFIEATAGVEDGQPISEVVYTTIANWALARYDLRVRALLRKAGLELPDDGPLTVEVIKERVRSAMDGVEVEELTPEGVMQAVDKKLAAQLSARLGFEVSTAFDAESAKAQVKAQILEALSNGSGAGILKGRTLRNLRLAGTLARAGVGREDYTTMMNRIYVRRYARSHARTWV